jgi:hypothetical protein
MLFLIEYDRPRGLIVQLRKFDDASRAAAQDERLKLELVLKRRGVEHEVVLLDAPSEEALRRTHGRYFENVVELVRGSPEVQALLMGTAKSLHESET